MNCIKRLGLALPAFLSSSALLTVVIWGGAAIAQAQPTKTPSAAEAGVSVAPFAAQEVTSPDGKAVVHWSVSGPTSLYVRSIAGGEEKLIASSKDKFADWSVVGGLSISPDSTRLAFEAGPARQFAGSVYGVKLDGTDFLVLATDVQKGAKATDSSPPSPFDMALSKPVFSPDGSKLLVEMDVGSGKRNEAGQIDDNDAKTYIALLKPDVAHQTPERLTEGRSLFWSTDGNAAFVNRAGSIYRYDLASKESALVLDASQKSILGKVPGSDALFVVSRDGKDGAVNVVNLDGREASESVKQFASGLQRKDADGRSLTAIEPGEAHHLVLRYTHSFAAFPKGMTPDDVRQLKSQGKLGEATKDVEFQ